MRWLVLALLVCVPHLASAQQAEDQRLWLEAGVEGKVGRRLELAATQQLRLGAEAGFVETHTQLEADVRIAKPFRIGALYRFIVQDGEQRHRIAGRADLKLERGRLSAGYRVTVQETFRPDGEQLVIRNRGKLGVAASRRLEPFVSIELHHQLAPVAEFREVRLVLGADYDLSKRWDLSAYYMFQDESNVQVPERNHVLGVDLIYQLGTTGGDRGPKE